MVLVGETVPLQFNHPNKSTDRYVRARVWNAAGTELGASPYALTHVANGLYRNLSLVMPSTGFLTVQYECFTDSGYTSADPTVKTVDDIIYKQEEAGSGGGGGDSDAAYERIIGTVSGDEIIGKVQEVS